MLVTSPFDSIWLEISTNRHTKRSKLQNGGLTPVPLTLLVIRVVLLLWSYGPHKGFWAQLYIQTEGQSLINKKTCHYFWTRNVYCVPVAQQRESSRLKNENTSFCWSITDPYFRSYLSINHTFWNRTKTSLFIPWKWVSRCTHLQSFTLHHTPHWR